MPNKNFIYIAICILITTILLLVNRNEKSSISTDNIFHINEISKISKIFLADRSGKTITLVRSANNWIVNDRFTVRKDAISTLLSTSAKIRVKKPVSKSAYDNVIKFMATTGVSVEFYDDQKMVKAYTIGSNTPDHLGTYMLLKGSAKPFVAHIPAFNGFLSPRYGIQNNILDVINWRSNNVFNFKSKAINSIVYTDYLNEKNSYHLLTQPFKLINSTLQTVPINNKVAMKLINSFEGLNCESFKIEKDMINFATMLEQLVVNFDTLRTYSISDSEVKNKENNFTVERKYATLNNGDLMIIQDYVFNKVLINIDELKE